MFVGYIASLRLGAEPPLPVHLELSATEAWLGENNQRVAKAFDTAWTNENTESWTERYEYIQDAKLRLQKFSQLDPAELSDRDLWEYACIKDEIVSGKALIFWLFP